VILNRKFLRSRVARRIFTLFVACALVPMAVFTTLAYFQVSRQLQGQNERELQQAAKSWGLAAYERFTILDSDLQVASLRIQHGDPVPAPAGEPHFQTTTVWKNQGGPEGISIASLTASEKSHLLSGKPLIRVDSCSADPKGGCIWMARMIDLDNPASGVIVGEVDSSYLWSADRLLADIDLLVLGADKKILYSSNPDKIAEATLPSLRNSSGFFEWRRHGTVHDAAYRDLFLRAEFLAGTWTVVVSQNHQDAFAPMQRFRDTLLLVALLVVWIVILFSLIQIRRTMGPLEKLGEATKQIAEQNFDALVNIASGDEFEDLAASFNSMSSRLGRQFHTLRAINDIDQAILSSLNRDAVISTALSRMATLLPSECFAIAVFQPNASDSVFVQVTVCETRLNLQRTFNNRIALPSELEQLQQNRSVQIPLEPRDTPDFLLPLKDLGMTSVFVFPIMVEHKPFAALVCGHSTTARMTSEDIHHAIQVADQLAVAFSNVQLIEAMEHLHWGTLTALARAIDAKSAWTAGHSERVTQLALKIGRAMDLSARDLQILHRGGLLHDIGKIGIAPEILDKPEKLNPQEMEHMRDHVRIGVRILEPIAAFTEVIPIVAQHHEWFNGGGYPEGLAGEAISLHGRIFAVADCYDAMVSDRPYRKGIPKKQAVEMIKGMSGIQFDPKVIDVFVRLYVENEATDFTKDDGRLVEQAT
jgi:putative nucleotidyltransferase with HDIG domain